MSSSSCGAQVGIYNITAIKLDKVKLSQLRVTHALAAVNQARVRSVTEGHDPVMRAAAAAALVHAKDVAMAETVAAAAASVASASAAAVPAAVPVVAAPAEPLADSTPVSAAAPLLATPVVELAAAAALAAAPLVVAVPLAEPLVVAAPLAAPLVVAVPLAAPAATSAAAPPSAVASVVSAAALAAGHTTNRSFYTAVGTGTLLVGKREKVVSTGAAPAAAPPPSLLSQVSRIVQTQSGLLPRHPHAHGPLPRRNTGETQHMRDATHESGQWAPNSLVVLVTLSCLAILVVVQVKSGLLPRLIERSIIGRYEWNYCGVSAQSGERGAQGADNHIMKDAREALAFWYSKISSKPRSQERRDMWRSYFDRSIKEGAHVAWYVTHDFYRALSLLAARLSALCSHSPS